MTIECDHRWKYGLICHAALTRRCRKCGLKERKPLKVKYETFLNYAYQFFWEYF